MDPRFYQITALAGLLAFGVLRLDFDIPADCIALTLASALVAQFACTRLFRLPRFDPRSALISAMSLCLLLRSDSYAVLAAAAAIAIASKFVLRWNGKHIFNPANLAVALCIALNWGWISPAQWGSATWLAFLFVCLGGLVVTRAQRADIALTFLLVYAGLLFARASWLGDPMTIPIKQLQSGTLLLFAFFMISDPRTTPSDFRGRLVMACAVAVAAFVLQFQLYNPKGLIYALALLSPLTMILDRVFPARIYQWPPTFTEASSHAQETARRRNA
jgi:enediyne biosynthesis protein E5